MAFKYIHTLFLEKANTIQMCSVWYWTCEKFYTVTQIIALTRKKLSITFSRWKMTEAWGCLINSTLEKNAHSNFVWNQHESINKIVFFFYCYYSYGYHILGKKKKKDTTTSQVSSSHTGLAFACFVCKTSICWWRPFHITECYSIE